jgi:hypothetical protein
MALQMQLPMRRRFYRRSDMTPLSGADSSGADPPHSPAQSTARHATARGSAPPLPVVASSLSLRASFAVVVAVGAARRGAAFWCPVVASPDLSPSSFMSDNMPFLVLLLRL